MFEVHLNGSARLAEFPVMEQAVEAALWFHKAINVEHNIDVVTADGSSILVLASVKKSK